MSVSVSSRMARVKPSATGAVLALATELRAQGRDIISLSVGEPDFETPAHIRQAAKDAMDAHRNGYAPSSGIPEAVEAVKREAGRKGISSICHTYITSGGSEAIELALRQLDRLHDPGLDAATLASGRNYLLGTYTLALETGPQLAAALSDLKFYGLPDEALSEYASRVAGVTREQTERVIQRVYPSRDELIYVLIGDAGAIREAATRYGELMELPISAPRFRP